MEDILKMAPMIAAEEAMAQGHAGGQATGMGGTTMMPGGGGGGGGAGQVGTIMGDTGQSTADVYNLFKKAGGGSLYALRRFGGGPIKKYQNGGDINPDRLLQALGDTLTTAERTVDIGGTPYTTPVDSMRVSAGQAPRFGDNLARQRASLPVYKLRELILKREHEQDPKTGGVTHKVHYSPDLTRRFRADAPYRQMVADSTAEEEALAEYAEKFQARTDSLDALPDLGNPELKGLEGLLEVMTGKSPFYTDRERVDFVERGGLSDPDHILREKYGSDTVDDFLYRYQRAKARDKIPPKIGERASGGPIKGYQEGGEFGDEFDEPMYRPPPRRRTARRRPSRAQQEAARRREAEMRRQRERAAAERAEEARMAEDIEPALPATIAAMPPPTPPPAPVEAPPENIEPVAPPRIVAPPPPPPAPVAPVAPPMGPDEPDEPVGTTAVPDVPVGTPPLGTLDDQFIDEVEQVLPTTTRSIPETDVSRFGPEVMPEPSEMGEGEGEEGAFTDADPGAYGTPSPRDAATTYPTGLSFEEEVERQVKQAQTQAEEEGEPDEEGVFEDDPMAEKARDLGVTPSGKLDETGDVVRDEEYIAAQGPYMGHGYEQPAPTAEAPTMAAPGEGEGLGLVDAPTGQQEPMNIFGAGADPFNMPTRADQFEDPRMQAMLNRLNTDPAPLRTMTPGKAEGGLIQEMQQDELGAQVLSEVMKALQDPEDAQNAETLASFQEAFGEEALQELTQTLQQGMAAEEQPMPMQTGGLIPGSGDAMADDKLGIVDAGQPSAYPIRYSSGEFIVAGDVVAGLGSGNSEAGAEVLNNLQDDVRMARNGTTEQAPPIDLSEVLPGTYGERYA